MKNSVGIIPVFCSLFLFLLASCTPHWNFEPLQTGKTEKLPPECAIKGACILVNDTYLEQSMDRWNGKPALTVVLRQEIAIVNERGLSFATIPLQGMRPFAREVTLTVADSTGRIVYQAPNTVLWQLRATGNIAVPNVMPGHRISLTIRGELIDVVDDLTFEFQRELPVVRNRFTMASYRPVFTYSMREQGSPRPDVLRDFEDDDDRFDVYRREYKSLPAPLMLPYQGWEQSRTPKLRLALETCPPCGISANTWKRRLPVQQSSSMWNRSEDRARDWQKPVYRLLDSLGAFQMPADSARHMLYSFVQNQFRVDTSYNEVFRRSTQGILNFADVLDVGAVVEKRAGSAFALTSLYASMLWILGNDATIFAVGSLSDHGIDYRFPSRDNRIYWMVRIKEGDRYRAAIPYLRGFRYGNYPVDIDPKVGVILPQQGAGTDSIGVPARVQDSIVYDVHIRLDSSGSSAQMTIIPSGLGLDHQRNLFASSSRRGQEALVLNWISELPQAFQLTSHHAIGVEDPSQPFSVEVNLKTPGLVVANQNQQIWRFGMLFDSYLNRLDSVRTEPVSIPVSTLVREHIYAPKNPGTGQIAWYCEPVKTPALEMTCSQEEVGGMLVFHRNVQKYAAHLWPQSFREQMPDIQRANRVRDSYFRL